MSACSCIHMDDGMIRDPACRVPDHRRQEQGWGTVRLDEDT